MRRNRTLVLNAPTESTQSTAPETNTGSPMSKDSGGMDSQNESANWVSKCDRHMQLINTAVYDKEKQLRKKAINETLRQRALQEEQQEKAIIAKHLQSINHHAGRPNAVHPSINPNKYEITIDGLRFRVMNGGSKLSRILGKVMQDHFAPCRTHTIQMFRIQPILPQSKLMLAAWFSIVVRMAIFTDPDSSNQRSKSRSSTSCTLFANYDCI